MKLGLEHLDEYCSRSRKLEKLLVFIKSHCSRNNLSFDCFFVVVCAPGLFESLCPSSSGSVATCDGRGLTLVPCEIPKSATEL
jgi:hypothetical protein